MTLSHALIIATMGQFSLLITLIAATWPRSWAILPQLGAQLCFAGLFLIVLGKDFGILPITHRLDASLMLGLALFMGAQAYALNTERKIPALAIAVAIGVFVSAGALSLTFPATRHAIAALSLALLGIILVVGVIISLDLFRRGLNWLQVSFISLCACVALAMSQALTERLTYWRIADSLTLATIAVFMLFMLLGSISVLSADRVKQAQRKSALNRLDSAALQSIQAQLRNLIETERGFTKAGLKKPDVALALHVSESAITEAVRRGLGENFFDYVNGVRIEHAKRQLAESDTYVTEIMYDVGFASKSSFNAEFKKRTGLTPGAYRSREKKVRL